MTLRLRDDVSTADTGTGTVLLDERTGRYFQLNPSGGLILKILLDGGSVADAVSAIVGEYAVDRSRAATDVEALYTALCEAGITVPVEAGPSN